VLNPENLGNELQRHEHLTNCKAGQQVSEVADIKWRQWACGYRVHDGSIVNWIEGITISLVLTVLGGRQSSLNAG
jgi:hypothetical protein